MAELTPIKDWKYWYDRCLAAENELASVRKSLGNRSLDSVLEEREEQDKKWGVQNHDPFTYLAILQEEVGELAQAALQTRFGGKHGGLDQVREEAVQTAAVALAIVECLDRGQWQWPELPKENERLREENERLKKINEDLYKMWD